MTREEYKAILVAIRTTIMMLELERDTKMEAINACDKGLQKKLVKGENYESNN